MIPSPLRAARVAGWDVGDLVATVGEAVVVLLVVAYVATADLRVLLVWEATSLVYLAAGGAVAVRQAVRETDTGRTGLLGSLSWVLPLVSSVAGVAAAVQALSAQPAAQRGDADSTLVAVAASVGIVISWLLFQVGMAQSYQALENRTSKQQLAFPATDHPGLVDFLYFAFAVGAAFATSDTRILARRARMLVIVHSTTAFFYSAFTVAVAYGVLQTLIPLPHL